MSLSFSYSTLADTQHKTFQQDFLEVMLEKFQKIIDNPANGFFHLTDKTEYLEQTYEVFEKIKNKKHFVQVGIGGSALGPQMLVSALRKEWSKSFTLLDNTDSDYIQDELNKINLKDSVFYIVSKSGGTAETIACYAIVKNLLEECGVPQEEFKNYFIFCTDKEKGQLREHVDKNQYTSLVVPDNVGGRFSVLTHVGLLPALFFGIDIKKLFEGANELKAQLLNKNASENPLLTCAAHIAYLYIEKEGEEKVNETVLMPYSSKLKDFSFWFVQLWAESLGKFSPEKNKPVGITPIPAYGATDQHSQMQLFMEGPINKLMFMLNIKTRENNFSLSSDLDLESAQKLNNYSMNDLLEAEFQGSIKALQENKRNIIEVNIDLLNESSLGQLILFYESLTALMGEYLFINPFDQPGVEKGKKYAFEYLNSLR